MKQNIPKMPCYLAIAVIMLLAACKKGDTGPQGPAGSAGAPGTANVIYSAWLDVKFIPIIQAGDTLYWETSITAPKLVDSILNKGEIKLYLNIGAANVPSIVSLPSDFHAIYPFFSVNKIYIVSADDVSTYTIPVGQTNAGQKTLQYRYILIAGGTAGRAAPGAKTVDWNNYKEVQAYLGLKD